jgi:hypothetical protein
MKPARYNLSMTKGVTFGPVLFYLADEDEVAVDLTGWTVFAEVRASANGSVIFDLQPQITNPEEGEITIEHTDEQTADLTPGLFRWDLILENPAGQRLGPYIVGSCNISAPISQP